jgi:hypothetical protein
MSTAILISGQLRTFARCWPTHRWHVLRHFADPHFFICVQAQPDWHEILAPLMAEYPDRVHVELKGDPDLSAHLTPELARAYHQAPYTNAAPAHQLLLQHWYQAECWKHFQRRQVTSDKGSSNKFDTFIRLRGDLWFHSFEWLNLIDVADEPACWMPWWGRFGGHNDRFAIMNPAAAPYYFTLFDHIPELIAAGCPFHPESLLKAALERGGVVACESLRTEFSTLRLNGSSRSPEIAPWDFAHVALRAA